MAGLFRTDSPMHGMTRSMRASLAGDAAIRRVHGLHTPLGVCPVAWLLS